MATRVSLPFVLAFIVVAGCGFPDLVTSQSLQMWMTTANTQEKLLTREPDLGGGSNPQGGYTIRVSRGNKDQSVKGYGAAISNSAAYLMYNSPEKESLLRELFNPETGIGISYIRLVMGGSDLNAVPPYTYNDIPRGDKDFQLSRFSIDKDKDFVIPCLRDILRHNPAVKILASPWTAPAWMKDNDNINGGQFITGDNYFTAYAEYFVRFIKAYQDEGIDIDALTIQNEPMHDANDYPTMKMWPDQQIGVINKLGPRLQQEGLSTAIVAWDHNWDGTWYPLDVLRDATARNYISGVGWHCYNGNRYDPQVVRNAHPDKDVYFTECSGGGWDPTFDSSFGFNIRQLFIGQSRMGARTVLLWSMALDENNGPKNVEGGCNDCRGVLTIPSNRGFGYIKNQEYYSIGHFSKFVRAGARRIEMTTHESNWLETAAFENPDGSVAMIIWNRSPDDIKRFDVELDGVWYNYALPIRTCITLMKY